MTAKIVTLSPEQELEFVAHRDAWRAIGTRTGHDQECEVTGRAAVVDAYKEIGVEPPTLVLWAQSPLQALLMHWALRGLIAKTPAVPAAIDLEKSVEPGAEYCSHRGCDPATGLPMREELERLGLGDVATRLGPLLASPAPEAPSPQSPT